jgi:plasmid stabilization system protein ParE
MIEVVFSQEAHLDIVEAYAWYEDRELGLGEDFLRRIEASLQSIQRAPEMYPVAVSPVRRAIIRRFPYEIFYEPYADSVFVYAVFHCSQDPEKWRKRLGV